MKIYINTLLWLLISASSYGQLSITPNQTAIYLANKLVATSGSLGVIISNAILNCDSNANGEFTGISNLGIADGIVLGTGDVATNLISNTFGLDGLPADNASTPNGYPGDAQLSAIITTNTFDACVLEFDIQPAGTSLEFEYVFGSEEYPEYICSFNDVFGFFISGPGFSSPTNIALIPTTNTPVSINTINDGTGICIANSSLYVSNTGNTTTMDGFTTPLIASANVTSGALYHLKLAIADAGDMIMNSYAIIKANSLKSVNIIPTGLLEYGHVYGLEVYPTLINSYLHIQNRSGNEWQLELIDMEGRVVCKAEIHTHTTKYIMNTTSLSKGIYLLNAKRMSDHQNYIQKVVKE